MRHADLRITLLALSFAALPAWADTLVMRDGKQVEGTFLGATTRQVDFLPASGKSVKVPLDRIQTIHVSAPPVRPAAAGTPAKQPARKAVTIPTGTSFRVRTMELIDVDSTQAGAKFRGSVDDPILMSGNVIVPRGADVILVANKVQQGGRMKGSDLIELKVNAISVGGRSYPVVTSLSETKSKGEGKKTAGKIVGGAGLGAIIGGIAGGGTGAAVGALVGGAGGTALAASGQPHLKIPAETPLQFQLLADWKVQ
jgi:hypothetical protein